VYVAGVASEARSKEQAASGTRVASADCLLLTTCTRRVAQDSSAERLQRQCRSRDPAATPTAHPPAQAAHHLDRCTPLPFAMRRPSPCESRHSEDTRKRTHTHIHILRGSRANTFTACIIPRGYRQGPHRRAVVVPYMALLLPSLLCRCPKGLTRSS
jgi:hypothetical protein